MRGSSPCDSSATFRSKYTTCISMLSLIGIYLRTFKLTTQMKRIVWFRNSCSIPGELSTDTTPSRNRWQICSDITEKNLPNVTDCLIGILYIPGRHLPIFNLLCSGFCDRIHRSVSEGREKRGNNSHNGVLPGKGAH